MAETSISWADYTWNPWIGCSKVSPACDGCYAEALMGMAGRHKRAAWGGPGQGVGTRSRTKTWGAPIKWDRAAAADGTRPFVFCASLADIFDNQVDPIWRADAFRVMRSTPNLVYLLLTKRPGLIHGLSIDAGGLPMNAAIGCTVVNQEEADRDIPKLLAAKVTRPLFAFLSMEPLLGDVDLTNIPARTGGPHRLNVLSGMWRGPNLVSAGPGPSLDWVITGGETDQGGHKARPQDPDWFRSLRDQCAATNVPYHHKQNGEWAPGELVEAKSGVVPVAWGDDDFGWTFGSENLARDDGHIDDEPTVYRIGKARAGRMLDGVVHDARPAVP